jgi:Fe-S cluster assembly protein SufD
LVSDSALGSARVAELRATAAERFQILPLPVLKDRGWEFTDLSRLELGGFPAPPPGDLDAAPVRAPVMSRDGHPGVLCVDGALRVMADGLPEGVVVTSIAAALESHPRLVEQYLGTLVSDRDKFAAQNTAGFEAGAFVHVPQGVRVEQPVMLSALQSAAGSGLLWRTLVVLEAGAEATVVEQYGSTDGELEAYFNPVTELVVGAGAKLEYLCAQDLSERSWILGTQRAQLGDDAFLHWIGLGLGSGQGKLRMETNINGRGASARVTGAYVGHGRQHIDYDTTQEHAAPDTVSDLAFRGILRDRATSVWSGMIRVDPGAQRTDAFQESRNLLLNDGAHADAIPGLEIEANDVRCTHAATVSRIDAGQIFYLMTRGLSRADAERLLVGGFLEVIAARLEHSDVLRDAVSAALERELEGALA